MSRNTRRRKTSARRPSHLSSTALVLPGLAKVYEVYLQTAEELVALPAALDAELWTCAQLGGLNTAAPHWDGYRYALADLIAVMEGAESRAALAFLRVVAAVGPTAVRSDADQGAIRLSQKGVADAGWAAALGKVTPGDAWMAAAGSEYAVLVEFRYPDGVGHHALLMTVASTLAGLVPLSIDVIGDVTAMLTATREDGFALDPVDSTKAGRRLRTALMNIESAPLQALSPEFLTNLPLAVQRVEVLNTPRGKAHPA